MAGGQPTTAYETMRPSCCRPAGAATTGVRDGFRRAWAEGQRRGRTVGVGVLLLGDDDRGGAVRELGGVAGGGGAVLLEGRGQLGQALHRGALAVRVVLGDGDLLLLARLLVDERGLDVDDFAVEEAGVPGLLAVVHGEHAHAVLALAGDAVLLGDVLARDAHRQQRVGVDRGVLGVREDARGPDVVLLAHLALGGERLDAEGHAHVGLAVADGARNVHDGLEAGGARTVRDLDRDDIGHARLELGNARLGEVDGGRADGHVADVGGVEAGLLETRLDDGRHELVGVRVLEPPAAHLGQRRPQGGDDDNVVRVGAAGHRVDGERLLDDVVGHLVDAVHCGRRGGLGLC